jgi:diphthine-ammonia ligase
MSKLIGCSWSGGKDSCYALMLAKQMGYVPKVLLNVLNEQGKVSRSHGLPIQLLNQQAEQLKLPLIAISASWENYETNFTDALKAIRQNYALEAMVFGDIDLQAHREWEEKVCQATALEALLPLWQRKRKQLVLEMLSEGMECMIVSCNKIMGPGYLGKFLNEKLIDELEQAGIDACGENGEFHTVVVNCPLFSESISLPDFDTHIHADYCFINWKI